MTGEPDAERRRLLEARAGTVDWKRWGPYVSARQWGTVREDYSPDGDAWSYFPHDHARSRAYRWGEDGLAGVCDRWQHLCLALALWNGRDPILKERLFGLANGEGNHGEDVKEYWWPLDSTPTHSWMRWLYRYPQAEFPYARLVEENRRRSLHDPDFELVDTGVFDGNRFFDVEVTYAKAGPNDLCVEFACTNHGPAAARLHLLPTVWLRNTWAWGRDDRRAQLWATGEGEALVEIGHGALGQFFLAAEGSPELLFTENETNAERLFGAPNRTPYTKDGINDHVVSGAPTVNPQRRGTKAAAWYRLDVPSGATVTRRLRLVARPPGPGTLGVSFTRALEARRAEADEFYATLAPPKVGDEARRVQRRALAGLLWSKKYYRYHVGEWLEGDPAGPPPPPGRAGGRNRDWAHLANTDVISMPDEWEYPWYAAWDLAFHAIPLALVDPNFAKNQLILLCREWYMHPNGQLPAYEWKLSDVNPPVHAWAAWRVYKIDARASGRPDREFLARVFQKLLLNFTWWVNRKDVKGDNVFEGGFLGLDNISLFDRSQALAAGELEQSDATSWMAMYCLNMLAIALELARHDRSYEDVATKFFEHFLSIAHAMNTIGQDGICLWDEEDGFFYDVLYCEGIGGVPLRVRSAVGVIPLFAVEILEPEVLDALPDFRDRMRWFRRHRPQLSDSVFTVAPTEAGERHLLSLVSPRRLRRVLGRVLDPGEFLSPYGVRSLSRVHAGHPVSLELAGQRHEVAYEPGESTTGTFGGNSNWRGPVWFPINYLLVESLQKFHHFMGDGYTVEFPTGSGCQAHLAEVAVELSRRLIALFLPDAEGRRPVNGGRGLFDHDPLWREHVTFNEYFHGETGAGLGANHQTGWTALVAKLIRQSGS
ncbi:MAG: MGH1-like glycoside hydrolase domain-containing protein [Egibacteraceae bacterium]